MKYLSIIFFCLFLYVGCGNAGPKSTDEYIDDALKNEEIQEGWGVKENRISLIEAIKNSENEGLLPEDYQYSKLIELEQKLDSLPEIKDEYHELLTTSYIKYLSDLKNGKINPREIYNDWDIEKKEIQPDSILSIALQKNKIDSTLESHKPTHFIYKNLKKALSLLKSMPEENFDTIATKEKFKLNTKSEIIAKIKERLRYWGDLNKDDTLANTTYNTDLKNAVIKFQNRHGLEADGAIGALTLKALNISKETRKQQIITNLERWRWYPSDLGNSYLGVNIPNYYLFVVDNKDTINKYRVVVGTPKRKSPILSSKISNIVFNPTWTVPPTIIKEDLVPDATKSRGYFSRTRIKIFNYKNQEISPNDWKPEDANKYRYVQEPGYNNSLGVVKINFPNNHLVYMHDTNHRDYFVYNYRALSSGCVRIEKPLPLAEYLLKNPKRYSSVKIDTIVKTKKTQAVKVDCDFKVHFQYFTAWYKKGQLQFRNDVYRLDSDLYLRLTNQFSSDVVSSARVIDK
ncbi:L,D-transpeptidase family protein [Flavobacterium terrae]|uniref:Murein L,D-transpeptidase YcbB/YkuD n=1 Tax=Flavobacterium terrae TaxID=415425 RepID=A0A1M6DSE5_9FLAO|nr:L,D-transpeptidase family protein [Flavobacterium terrae]SHI76176.1 Murein L,D-transpeptidase YcbB/YkuD [Flavobacterium terrae]